MSAQQRLAICGYGRFGAALSELACEKGYRVSAFDPAAEVPAALRADSLESLCASAQTLLLCVPLELFDESLSALRPHLTEAHLVLDVGSVKSDPVRAMRDSLEGCSQWIGTHPLFGPTSLARGERPLRVVLCEGSEGSLAGARKLWEALGCECLEQSAEEHDRAMARSHALAFFLAKGLLEIRAGEGAAFTPPSFEAIEKTIDAVRSDAGHLFRSIQNRNPFAAEERARLIAALSRIDGALAQPASESQPATLDLPSLESPAARQKTGPELLSELDEELLALLARRSVLAARLSPEERKTALASIAGAGAGAVHSLSHEHRAVLVRLLGEA